ncbi:hypothetical protein Asera_24010 [Actinocatenispora sera]|uniref:Uncharacterized protein n=1 Tax=Actinocatenispora sera TaxID=390989 RepID=A0A810KYM5_9ACTN|nr:hypothetical protein Asera_24010 [Actinocatenispora sera]
MDSAPVSGLVKSEDPASHEVRAPSLNSRRHSRAAGLVRPPNRGPHAIARPGRQAPTFEPRLPTTAASADRSTDGLPVGVQPVGPMFADRTPLRLAELLEREVAASTRRPGEPASLPSR